MCSSSPPPGRKPSPPHGVVPGPELPGRARRRRATVSSRSLTGPSSPSGILGHEAVVELARGRRRAVRSNGVENERWATTSAVVFDLEPAGAAEVVGVGVGDEHRVDAFRRHADRVQLARSDRRGNRVREAGIDEGHAALVLEHVAVHVAEPGNGDRDLDATDPGSDLVDARPVRVGVPVGPVVRSPGRHWVDGLTHPADLGCLRWLGTPAVRRARGPAWGRNTCSRQYRSSFTLSLMSSMRPVGR